jgi:hypothetical protein
MGVLKQGILGGFSGKVANVVGSSWKGIAVIKALPLSVANPNTASQQIYRNRIKYCCLFALNILTNTIKPCWDRFAMRMSGFNAFIKANRTIFDSTGLVTPASLVISSGKMAATAISAVTTGNATKTVKIDWVDDSGSGYKLASDEAYAVAYNATTKEVMGHTNPAPATRRDAATLTITFIANNTTGDHVHCYLAFRRADGTVVSETDYYDETV